MHQASRIVAFAALLTAAGAADAHHSYSMFDMTRVATVHGEVKVVEWTNPHVWLWIDSGGPYAFETVSPGELTRFWGWTPTSLPIGQKITVEFAPLRSGKQGGAVRRITLENGKTLETPLAHMPAGGPPTGSSHANH